MTVSNRDFHDFHKPVKKATSRKALKTNHKNTDDVDFDKLNNNLLLQAEQFISSLLPGGKFKGKEYIVSNPNRTDKTPGSFSISIRTGRWGDFATGDRGRDLISLYGFVKGLGNVEAAREILCNVNT